MKKFIPAGFIAFFCLIQFTVFAQPCSSNGALVSVTYKKTAGTEYLIFKFKQTCTLPTVSLASPPFIEDPSGNTITVAGAKHFSLVFQPLEWTCTVPIIMQSPITASSKLRAIKKGGQFEGVFTYWLGMKSTANLAQVLPTQTTGGYCYLKYIIF